MSNTGVIVAVRRPSSLEPALLMRRFGRPVRPFTNLTDARALLEEGEYVGISPEINPSIAHLAIQTGSSIVPMGELDHGAHIGPPIVPRSTGRSTMRNRLALTSEIITAVAALSGGRGGEAPTGLLVGGPIRY